MKEIMEKLALNDNELVRIKFEICESRMAFLLKIIIDKKLVRSVKADKDKDMEGRNIEETALAQTLLLLFGKKLATLRFLGVTFVPILSKVQHNTVGFNLVQGSARTVTKR